MPCIAPGGEPDACQRIAYLATARKIEVQDLAMATTAAAFVHVSRIDWLVQST